MSNISKADRQAAFAKVFSGVKVSFSRRTHDMEEAGRTEIRIGKTARDKAKGHTPYKKNQRVWDKVARLWLKV